MRNLGTLGAFDSQAFGINDATQVVGVAGPHAFLWTPARGMEDLGTLAVRSVSP